MNHADPTAAAHLAQLADRFEGHLGALRRRAAEAVDAMERSADALQERAAPRPADAPPAGDATVVAVDDDGIPRWDDPAPR